MPEDKKMFTTGDNNDLSNPVCCVCVCHMNCSCVCSKFTALVLSSEVLNSLKQSTQTTRFVRFSQSSLRGAEMQSLFLLEYTVQRPVILVASSDAWTVRLKS